MLRAIVSVVVGYVVMSVVVFALFSGAYLAMGQDRAYKPGSYDVSTLWLVVWGVGTILASVAGGAACALIARRPKPVMALAIVVFILGVLSAIPTLTRKDPGPRPADTDLMTAVKNSKQPVWTAFANPVIVVAGAIAGGRMVLCKKAVRS